MASAEKLTRNQSLVLGALANAGGPLSAYDILDRLRPEGLRSPLQIYRALNPLMEHGLVHRLESLNSFVACAHPGDFGHVCSRTRGVVAFAICDTCGQVDEFADDEVTERLGAWATAQRFTVAKTTVEMRGTCANCLPA